MDTAPLLEAKGLGVSARVGAVRVAGLDLAVRPGESLVLVGPIEAASAVLRALVGIEIPDAGTARVLGADPATLPRREAAALLARVGWYPRSGALLANLTLRENLLLPYLFHRPGATDGARATAAALTRFGLGDAEDVRPEEVPLSTGRRVALARALLLDPEVLVLDDPLDDLDEETVRQVLAALAAWLRERPRGLVISTNRPGVAAQLGAPALTLPVTRA